MEQSHERANERANRIASDGDRDKIGKEEYIISTTLDHDPGGGQ